MNTNGEGRSQSLRHARTQTSRASAAALGRESTRMKGAHAGVTELLEPESYLMGTESYGGQLVSHTPAEITHFLN